MPGAYWKPLRALNEARALDPSVETVTVGAADLEALIYLFAYNEADAKRYDRVRSMFRGVIHQGDGTRLAQFECTNGREDDIDADDVIDRDIQHGMPMRCERFGPIHDAAQERMKTNVAGLRVEF